MERGCLARSLRAGGPRSDKTADAIVVLGARLHTDGTPSGTMRRRVALGVRLYQEGAAPLLVVSGGGNGPMPEAEVMARLTDAAGVSRSALLVEAKSQSTVENALFCARLLHDRGVRRVVLVSDRVHLPRAALLFRLAGLRVVKRAGVPTSSRSAALAAVLHEAASLPGSLVRMFRQRDRPSRNSSGRTRGPCHGPR